MNRILKKHLALSAALALFSLTSGHAMAQLDKQKVERIDVVGQKTTPRHRSDDELKKPEFGGLPSTIALGSNLGGIMECKGDLQALGNDGR